MPDHQSAHPRALSRRTLLLRGGGLGITALTMPWLLEACGQDSSTSSAGDATIRAGGNLRAALTGEPDSLDPAVSSVYTGAQVYDNIFSKLLRFDPEGKFVGDLATKWTADDDKTWTFDLVDNATFHNGEKFTAKDVKYSFDRILNPKTASSYAGLFSTIDSVEVKSDTQVTFHLKSAFGPFLTNLANNGEIVNQKAIEADDPARKPVGTGPFSFVEWVQGDHIKLDKASAYHKEGLPHLDSIEFKFMLVDQSRIDALSGGELDWADAIPLQQVATLSKDPRFTYKTSAVAGIPDFLAMNTKKAPFDKLEVRQAIGWALDRDAIRQVAYSGTGEVGVEEVPSGSSWYDGQDFYESGPDVAKAKQLLADAGYPNGLSIEYLGLPQYPELLKTGVTVADQLKAVGIDMKIKQVDVSVWFDAFSKGDYQITSAYQERTIDPDNFYALVLRSGGPINTTFYSNAKVDKLIDQAAHMTDEAQRKALYTQIRGIVQEEAPIIFVHFETIHYLMNKNVAGSEVTEALELNLENVGFTSN
ncbi:MAG TPA: ABC transporter substrate-binding protein [Nocardioides sp.]|nr:ABC transporter substrate-binding protein [Nocardioides sp.]